MGRNFAFYPARNNSGILFSFAVPLLSGAREFTSKEFAAAGKCLCAPLEISSFRPMFIGRENADSEITTANPGWNFIMVTRDQILLKLIWTYRITNSWLNSSHLRENTLEAVAINYNLITNNREFLRRVANCTKILLSGLFTLKFLLCPRRELEEGRDEAIERQIRAVSISFKYKTNRHIKMRHK